MKLWIKILIGVAILAVIITAIYIYKKRKQAKEDLKILNGLTADEFLRIMTKKWKDKFYEGQMNYLTDVNVHPQFEINPYGDNEQNEWQEFKDGEPVYNSKELEEIMAREIPKIVDNIWSTNPNPLDYDWARYYWLPSAVDNLGINYNNPRVKELIKKLPA